MHSQGDRYKWYLLLDIGIAKFQTRDDYRLKNASIMNNLLLKRYKYEVKITG